MVYVGDAAETICFGAVVVNAMQPRTKRYGTSSTAPIELLVVYCWYWNPIDGPEQTKHNRIFKWMANSKHQWNSLQSMMQTNHFQCSSKFLATMVVSHLWIYQLIYGPHRRALLPVATRIRFACVPANRLPAQVHSFRSPNVLRIGSELFRTSVRHQKTDEWFEWRSIAWQSSKSSANYLLKERSLSGWK